MRCKSKTRQQQPQTVYPHQQRHRRFHAPDCNGTSSVAACCNDMGMHWVHLACRQSRPGFESGENNTFELSMLAVLMLHFFLRKLVLHESLLGSCWHLIALHCNLLYLFAQSHNEHVYADGTSILLDGMPLKNMSAFTPSAADAPARMSRSTTPGTSTPSARQSVTSKLPVAPLVTSAGEHIMCQRLNSLGLFD